MEKKVLIKGNNLLFCFKLSSLIEEKNVYGTIFLTLRDDFP